MSGSWDGIRFKGQPWGGGGKGGRQAKVVRGVLSSARKEGRREEEGEGKRTRLVILLVVDTEVLPAGLTKAGLGPYREHGEFGIHAVHAADGAEGVAPEALFVLEGGEDGTALGEGEEGGKGGRREGDMI